MSNKKKDKIILRNPKEKFILNVVEQFNIEAKILVNNQNAPLNIVDDKGNTVLSLDPYQKFDLFENKELFKKLNMNEHFKNCIAKGLISLVDWQ